MDLLRLARSPAVQMSVLVAGNRAEVTKAATKAAAASAKEWHAELKAAVDYIKLVRGNNLKRGEAVYDRPDVKFAIAQATEAAAKLAGERVDAGWTKGYNLGVDHALSEAVKVGVPAPEAVVLQSPLLDKLKGDASNLAGDANKKFRQASGAENWDEALDKLLKAYRLRGQMIAEASVKQAHAAAKAECLKGGDTDAMWVAQLGGTPCSHCMRLHGTVRAWGAAFPDEFYDLPHLGTWGPLLGPPRHPNCRCVLVPVPKAASIL